MRRLLGLFALLAAASACLAQSAGQALATTVHCGDVITHDVRLDADLTNCSGDGLVVGAANVTIDLNGHTISGMGSGWGIANFTPKAIEEKFDGPGYSGFTLQSGTIRGFATAIYDLSDQQTFRRLTVDGEIGPCCFARHGYSSPNGGRLLDSRVIGLASMGRAAVVSGNRLEGGLLVGSGEVTRNTLLGGLRQYGTRVARNGPLDIEDNVISGSERSGVGLVGSLGTRVARNTIYGNRGDGLSIYSEAGLGTYTITRNRIYSNGGHGIGAEGPVCEDVSGNRIFRNAGSGVHADYRGQDRSDSTGTCSPPHRYLRNHLYLNGAAGIDASHYRSALVLRGNSADRNSADGINVGAGTIFDQNPSWSPDGRQIAFQSDRAGGWDVFVANADGTGVRRLTTAGGTEPRWSPEGSSIAFESYAGGALGLYVVRLDGSGLRKLAELGQEDPGFAWSPDGKQIAFGGDFLYIVNADGTGLRQVSDIPSIAGPTWSPTGTRIAFQATRGISVRAPWLFVVNADGSNPTAFSSFPTSLDAAWSPDGTRIAVTDITTVDADGNDLPFGTYITRGTHPQWSPDGKMLTFDSAQGAVPRYNTDVFVVNANGTGRTNLTKTDLYGETRPVWSPDGSRIAYNVTADGVNEVNTIRPDGSGRTPLLNDFPATLKSNSADHNEALGIDVVPGVADGGGNKAKQNGDPRQCLNIVCNATGKSKK